MGVERDMGVEGLVQLNPELALGVAPEREPDPLQRLLRWCGTWLIQRCEGVRVVIGDGWECLERTRTFLARGLLATSEADDQHCPQPVCVRSESRCLLFNAGRREEKGVSESNENRFCPPHRGARSPC